MDSDRVTRSNESILVSLIGQPYGKAGCKHDYCRDISCEQIYLDFEEGSLFLEPTRRS